MQIRELRPGDYGQWLRLRELLWPESSQAELAAEQREIVANSAKSSVWVAAEPEAGLVGFVEVALRDWSEGCSTHPVGYIEGWYVKPEHRRHGVGRKLIAAAEGWVRSQGCTEMGSDVDLPNDLSHQAHRALGYVEVARIVLYRKQLKS